MANARQLQTPPQPMPPFPPINIPSDPKAAKRAQKARRKAEKGSKGKTAIIIISIFVFIVIVSVLMAIFNVFGVRENVIYPVLRSIPFLADLVPEAAEPEVDPRVRITELEVYVSGLQSRYTALQADNEYLLDRIEQQNLEIARLREFYDAHMEFEAQREEFQRMLVEGDPDAFYAHFWTIHPDLALEEFIRIAERRHQDEEWLNYVRTWSVMTPAPVAAAIEIMHLTRMDIVVNVMLSLPEVNRGRILDLLGDQTLASVLTQMYMAQAAP